MFISCDACHVLHVIGCMHVMCRMECVAWNMFYVVCCILCVAFIVLHVIQGDFCYWPPYNLTKSQAHYKMLFSEHLGGKPVCFIIGIGLSPIRGWGA